MSEWMDAILQIMAILGLSFVAGLGFTLGIVTVLKAYGLIAKK